MHRKWLYWIVLTLMPAAPLNILGYATLRLDYFSPWTALGIFTCLGSTTILLGLRSLAGLGPVRKWVAIVVRLLVLLLLILILGDIQWVRQNTAVEVMVVRDISRSTQLVRDFPGQFLQSSIDDYLIQATSPANSASHQEGDKVGEISFNEQPFIDAIPSDKLSLSAAPSAAPAPAPTPRPLSSLVLLRWTATPCTACF